MGWKDAPVVAAWQQAPPVSQYPVTASIGPVEGRDQIRGAGMAQAGAQAAEIEGQIPPFQRFTMNAEQYAPLLMGGVGGVATGGAGLIPSALIAGGFGGAGEFARQRMAGEPMDPTAALEEGGKQAAGGIVGGGILKGLGLLASKFFRTPLSASAKKAAAFASEENVPFPLASAVPGSPAGMAQGLSQGSLPGHLRTVSDANKVTQFLNQRIGTYTEKAAVFDEAARKGQAWFDNLINPNRAGANEAWTRLEAAAGQSPIRVDRTLTAVREARDLLKRSSTLPTDDFLMTLEATLAQPDKVRFASELNLFQDNVARYGFKRGYAQHARKIQDAMEADVVDFANKGAMPDVATEFTEGLARRAMYRDLAKIPGFERLAGELGPGGKKATKGTIDWMNTLFREENAKALAKLRSAEPDLFHELQDAWLGSQIQKFSRSDGMFKYVDGAGLRTWFVQTSPKLSQFYTKEQIQALDNFTLYAQHMTGAQQKAQKGMGDMSWLVGRAAAELTGTFKKPLLFVPTQASAYMLARGLSDPNSALFKAFTEGFSPQFRSFVVKSGQLAGQAGAAQK